jgi:hypothetical protein
MVGFSSPPMINVARLHPKQLRLLCSELFFGENPLGLESAEAFELGDHILFWGGRGGIKTKRKISSIYAERSEGLILTVGSRDNRVLLQ